MCAYEILIIARPFPLAIPHSPCLPLSNALPEELARAHQPAPAPEPAPNSGKPSRLGLVALGVRVLLTFEAQLVKSRTNGPRVTKRVVRINNFRDVMVAIIAR